MSKRTIGIVLIILGVVLVILSLTADVIGVGAVTGFGWKQILGTAAGCVAVLGGAWMILRITNQSKM